MPFLLYKSECSHLPYLPHRNATRLKAAVRVEASQATKTVTGNLHLELHTLHRV